MAKRLTPIERAIAGEPTDRRARYVKRLQDRGLTYVRVVVPVDQVDQVKAFARDLVERSGATDSGLAGTTNDHD